MTKLVTISVPAHTVQALDEAAKKEGRSRSNFIVLILKQALTQLHATKDIKNIRIGVEEY